LRDDEKESQPSGCMRLLVSLLEMICFDPAGNGWKFIIIVPNLGG
jgi:hypothetical protein